MNELDVIVRVFRKGWWIVPWMVLIAVAGVIVMSSIATPQYRTNARLVVVTDPSVVEGRDLIDSYEKLGEVSIVATFVEIANSARVREEVREDLGLTPEEMENYPSSAVVLPNTNVIQLSVSGPNPELVKQTADRVSENTIGYVSEKYKGYVLELLDTPGLPLSPYSPNLKRDGAIAVFLGMVLGIFLAILYDLLGASSLILTFSKSRDHSTHALKRSYLERYLMDLTNGQEDIPVNLGLIRLTGLKTLEKEMSNDLLTRILRSVTRYIQQEIRGRDLVARWNEDSYAVLLTGLDVSEAQVVMERLQAGLQNPKLFSSISQYVLLKPQTGLVASTNKEKLSVIINQAETILDNSSLSETQPSIFKPVSG